MIESQGVMGQELMLAFSSLPFGRFDYAVRGDGEVLATGSFEVAAGPEPQQRVAIALDRPH